MVIAAGDGTDYAPLEPFLAKLTQRARAGL
jgi:hypothetical protein